MGIFSAFTRPNKKTIVAAPVAPSAEESQKVEAYISATNNLFNRWLNAPLFNSLRPNLLFPATTDIRSKASVDRIFRDQGVTQGYAKRSYRVGKEAFLAQVYQLIGETRYALENAKALRDITRLLIQFLFNISQQAHRQKKLLKKSRGFLTSALSFDDSKIDEIAKKLEDEIKETTAAVPGKLDITREIAQIRADILQAITSGLRTNLEDSYSSEDLPDAIMLDINRSGCNFIQGEGDKKNSLPLGGGDDNLDWSSYINRVSQFFNIPPENTKKIVSLLHQSCWGACVNLQSSLGNFDLYAKVGDYQVSLEYHAGHICYRFKNTIEYIDTQKYVKSSKKIDAFDLEFVITAAWYSCGARPLVTKLELNITQPACMFIPKAQRDLVVLLTEVLPSSRDIAQLVVHLTGPQKKQILHDENALKSLAQQPQFMRVVNQRYQQLLEEPIQDPALQKYGSCVRHLAAQYQMFLEALGNDTQKANEYLKERGLASNTNAQQQYLAERRGQLWGFLRNDTTDCCYMDDEQLRHYVETEMQHIYEYLLLSNFLYYEKIITMATLLDKEKHAA